MLNRISHAEAGPPPAPHRRGWDMDGRPVVRLAWLFGLMMLPLSAVLARLVHLQGVITLDGIVDEYLQTTVVVEPIETRDGRILSADGRVLARDVQRYDVLAHYRWIEEPADEGWLWQQAVRRLDPGKRDDRRAVDDQKQRQLAVRDQMWARLAALTATTPRELTDRRKAVQARVERILRRVERRRRRRAAEQSGPPLARFGPDAPWWQVAWKTVVATLTTPPKRIAPDPLVVSEELDYHPIVEDVGLAAATEIEANPELFPGLKVRVATRRVYPQRSPAAHIVGNRLPARQEDLQRRAEMFPDGDPLDYKPGDRIGRTGVERSYDRRLRGTRGQRRVVKNRRGEIIQVTDLRRPRPGEDVYLTLDLSLQKKAEQLLDERLATAQAPGSGPLAPSGGGAAVVLDVHTGAVLAAAAAPRFDLNLLLDPDPELWRRMSEDSRRPFFPRTRQMTLPPGSVFKTLTAVALLESGRFDPDKKHFCRGYLDDPGSFRCYIYTHYGYGHGEMDLTDALAQSCNVYFFSAARQVGPHVIVDWARRFGFGRPTGIDLPGESAGNVPIPPGRSRVEGQGSRRGGEPISDFGLRSSEIRNLHSPLTTHSDSRPSPPWYRGDTLGLAIGQSRLTATPLQIARMMAAVANGGYLVRPHVVSHTGSGFGAAASDSLAAGRQPRRIPGLTEAALDRVREGLEQVVANPRGTGYKRVRLTEIAIAGKTGTAEVAGKGDHAWFAGYVPADNPRYAFAVVLEHAGSGGQNAGPVAKRLVETMLEVRLLEARRVTSNP